MTAFLKKKSNITFFSLLMICLGWIACNNDQPAPALSAFPIPDVTYSTDRHTSPATFHLVQKKVRIRDYFKFMDSLVAQYDSLSGNAIDEYVIAHANPWLIDSLAATDYYRMMARDSFVYDPQALVILQQGDSLLIPDSSLVAAIRKKMDSTVIDINLPEFTLRIKEGEQTLYKFPVRIGRNERKYLAMAGRVVDLRTRTGTGEVIRVNRTPVFINPSNNKRYEVTRRDDGRVTKLPGIPWIEAELDGRRYGQLIHPTTNQETVGKAYSNGCIGTREGDAWIIYYYAPLGTKVVVRYNLQVIDESGDTLQLRNIYPGRRQTAQRRDHQTNRKQAAPYLLCSCRSNYG